jgi:hypothetical protein
VAFARIKRCLAAGFVSRELPAKILNKDFLESRVDLNRLFANQIEALVLSGKDFL